MIRCLASQVLEFKNGNEKEVTKLGFCELADWVEKTDYYQAAVKSGLIKSFESNNSKAEEEAVKATEKLAALNLEIKAAEEKAERLAASAPAETVPEETEQKKVKK